MASTQDLPSSEIVLNLDWRHGSTRRELINKLVALLTTLDGEGSLKMMLSGSQVKQMGQRQLDAGEVARMFLHKAKWTKRDLHTKSGDKYLPQVYIVARHLLKLVANGVPEHKRMFGYELRTVTFTAPKIERKWYDIALTLEEHPFRFGIVPDCQGQFCIPRGWELVMTKCYDILTYADSKDEPRNSVPDGCEEEKVTEHRAHAIPPLVRNIRLSRRIGIEAEDLKAVFVMEHRNIKMTMDIASRRPGSNLSGMLFVLTGGFADFATREFITLLGRVKALANVPFFFVSDHDPDAFEIYSNCKFGSCRAAFSSMTMACPRLEWKGPTRAQYEAISLRGIERKVAERAEAAGGMTPEVRRKVEQRITRETRNHIKETFSSTAAKLTKRDRMRIDHFTRGRALENETLLLEELKSMTTTGKFPLAALQKENPLGIEELCVDIVSAFYKEQPVYNVPKQKITALSQLFDDLPSSQGMPASQSQLTASTNVEDSQRPHAQQTMGTGGFSETVAGAGSSSGARARREEERLREETRQSRRNFAMNLMGEMSGILGT